MYSPSNSKAHCAIPLALAASLLLAACGGGSDTDTSAPPVIPPSPPPSAPAIADNVLFSVTPGIGVVATINKAGYLRAYDMSNGHPVTIALGSAPMRGSAASATGDGWLLSSAVFSHSTVSLNSNSGTSTYTLKAQSAIGQTSNSTMQLASNLQRPTLSSLAGNYGISPHFTMTVSGTSFTGNYGYACSWSGTMSPNSKTIDVTNIKFQNMAGQICPYAGRDFNGTAYLLGPSAANAKGAIDILLDDGGSSMPTVIDFYGFTRQ
jgi:hypothetical protein